MKTAVNLPPVAVMAGAAVLGLFALVWLKKKPNQSLGASAGAAAVETVADVGTGVVLGVGDVFGIPNTDTDQCSKDIAAGDTWAASFSCPAKRWLSESVFGTTPPANTGGATGTW